MWVGGGGAPAVPHVNRAAAALGGLGCVGNGAAARHHRRRCWALRQRWVACLKGRLAKDGARFVLIATTSPLPHVRPLSLPAAPLQVWFCTVKGLNPWFNPDAKNTRTTDQGGHTIW